jgi:hypothetical protein
MRRTRFISFLFLVGALAFFFIPDFRQSFRAPLISIRAANQYGKHSPGRVLKDTPGVGGPLPAKMLEQAAKLAEESRDGRTLAFVALRYPAGAEGVRLADEAVALDPQYTWIYYSLISPYRGKADPISDQWPAKLQAWDPDNAVPYLAAAEGILYKKGVHWVAPQDLASESEWLQAMQKAFAAPRYDTYTLRRFDLERSWLIEHRLARADTLLWSMGSYPIPDLLNVSNYELLVERLGRDAERAKKLPEALNDYWTVAHFGERMQLSGVSLTEALEAADVQVDAYDRLVPLLRQMKRTDEAATTDYARAQMHQQVETLLGRDPLVKSSNFNWAASMVLLFAGLTVIFGLLSLLTVGYVNAKRWIRPEKRGLMFQFLTVAENYMPILFFLSCLSLYISYYPFAQNFHYYLTASGNIHDLGPLWYNVYPAPGLKPVYQDLDFEYPFRTYAFYAIAGAIVVSIYDILALAKRRGPQQP